MMTMMMSTARMSWIMTRRIKMLVWRYYSDGDQTIIKRTFLLAMGMDRKGDNCGDDDSDDDGVLDDDDRYIDASIIYTE